MYDLNNKHIHYGEIPEDVESSPNGNFIVTLPRSKFKIEIKRMTGKDEQEMMEQRCRLKSFGAN